MIAITTTHTALLAATIRFMYVTARQTNFALCYRRSVCPSQLPSHGCTEAFPHCVQVYIFLECVESRQSIIGKIVLEDTFLCIVLSKNICLW